MLKSTRKQQIEKLIHAGINNLYRSQSEFSFDKFAITPLKGLMLLEIEEYRRTLLTTR